jgi:hypothetical protein
LAPFGTGLHRAANACRRVGRLELGGSGDDLGRHPTAWRGGVEAVGHGCDDRARLSATVEQLSDLDDATA